MKKITICIATALISHGANAATLALVNFAGANPQPVEAVTFSDYAAFDATITSGTVTEVAGNPPPTTTIGGLTVTTVASNGSFNTGRTPQNIAPIFDSYLFDANTTTQDVTITGLGSVANIGETFTLTLYGIGDTSTFADSGTAFTVSYGGASLGTQETTRGTQDTVQFNFASDGTSDDIVISWAKKSDDSDTSGFNGFSLTTNPIPEPSSALLLGLGGLALLRRRR